MRQSSDAFWLAGLLLVLLLACVGGLAFVLWVRKWVKDEGPAVRQEGGFTLSDLRALYKSGKMSSEEFERAREKIVTQARRNMPGAIRDRPAAGVSRPPGQRDPSTGSDAPGGGESAG